MRRSFKRVVGICIAVGLLLYLSGIGLVSAAGCRLERLPMDEMGFDHKHIPPQIDSATLPAGATVRCGNVFWSYDIWRVGLVKVVRCNF